MSALPAGPPLPTVLQTLLWIRRPVEMMEYCRGHYGPTFSIRLPPFRLALFSEPEPIRAMFAARPDEMYAGGVNRILRVLVGGRSVLLLDGAEHMRHRKLLMPSFHGERMRLYGQTMAEITRRTIADWPVDRPFVLHEHTQEIALQIILRTVFGANEGAELDALRLQITRLLAFGGQRTAMLPVLYLARHPEAETRAPWKWLLAARRRTDELLYAQIAARRAQLGASERTDVLAMLLSARDEAGQAMTDQELRDELMTALAAGHETTATALAWAFEQILSDRGVYERLRADVRACDGDLERLVALPFLDATIKEVLRLRPVVPVVGRVLQKPCELGGFSLPAGTTVGACIYLAQRNPDVYPEPDAFRPERFERGQPDPGAWLPFGGGIRRCVGAAFALYEMKIVLGTILANCDLELAQAAPSRVVRRAITFWPEGGTRVRLLARA